MNFKTMATAAAIGWGAAHAAEPTAKSGIVRANFDAGVRPQDDLFLHVNGTWLTKTTIPSDRPADGAFYGLRDLSEERVKALIEELAKSAGNADERKIADLFASFMDEKRAEELGLEPIRAELASVAAIEDRVGLIRRMAALQRTGVQGLFGGFVQVDSKKSDEYIVYVNQGGLGLPDESYYREAKHEHIRKAYVAHVAKMLTLAKVAEPEKAAAKIFEMESLLAKSHWDRVKSRDADKTYNKMTLDQLAQSAGGFDFPAYFDAFGAKNVNSVIVRQPNYFADLSKTLDAFPLADWKSYLTIRVLSARAPYLNEAFAKQQFEFTSKTLSGIPEMEPRWKRGVKTVEGALGEAVGRMYVAKHFPPEAKDRMKVLVANLIEAYRLDIQALDWMTPETKSKALAKLAKFDPKIGYPDKWRDYSKLEIAKDDLVGNTRRSAEFATDFNLGKLGKPVDKTEWGMTPQTVNAYYNPTKNEIVFPAAILQPPFFDLTADDAVNYGGIGAVIGHEIGHGFDDQGSKYDGDGNLRNWWSLEDRREFEKRAKALIDQYSAFEPRQLSGQRVNGALTIGENIGDLGGLTIAHKAYMLSLGGKPAPTIDGFTGPQRFFIGWAQVWRSKIRDAALAQRLATDPHSPAEFRCNGVVRNLAEFYEAFGVKEGDRLWMPEKARVRIW